MVARAHIVFLNSRNHLTDATGHDCRYRTADGQPLLPGYWYRVSWPKDVEEPLFDAKAHYGGPYDSEEEARNAVADTSSTSRFARIAPSGTQDSRRVPDVAYFPDRHCAR
jgi:hypothetical protein